MSKLNNLELFATNLQRQLNDKWKEAKFCREHNFNIQAQILSDQAAIIQQILLDFEIKFRIDL